MFNNDFYNESQNLLDRNFRSFRIFFKLLFSIVVFSPLWFWSFYLERKITKGTYPPLKELLLILVLSVLMYGIIFFLKGILISFRERKSSFWVFLLILYMGIFEAVPGWCFYELFKRSLDPWYNFVGALLVAIAICDYYRFHRPGATLMGRPAYQLGKWFGDKI